MKVTSIIFLSALLTLLVCGCSSLQPVGTDINQEGLKDKIAPGDKIVIHTKDNRSFLSEYTVTVKSITKEKIIGEDVYHNERGFYFSNNESIEKDQLDSRKTTKNIIVGVLAGADLVVILPVAVIFAAAVSMSQQ